MSKPAATDAKLKETSADDTVAAAMKAMEAQIAALTAENAKLKAGGPVGENEKFSPVDFEDPAVMSMMERRGDIPKHPTTGAPIFNPHRAAVRPPA